MSFLWYTQEIGYKAGSEITKDMSGGILQDITKGASILGMFILAVLVQRWVNINLLSMFAKVQLDEKAYIHWDKLPEGSKGIQEAFAQVGQGLSQTSEKSYYFPTKLGYVDPWTIRTTPYFPFACTCLRKKYLQSLLSLHSSQWVLWAHVLHIM